MPTGFVTALGVPDTGRNHGPGRLSPLSGRGAVRWQPHVPRLEAFVSRGLGRLRNFGALETEVKLLGYNIMFCDRQDGIEHLLVLGFTAGHAYSVSLIWSGKGATPSTLAMDPAPSTRTTVW